MSQFFHNAVQFVEVHWFLYLVAAYFISKAFVRTMFKEGGQGIRVSLRRTWLSRSIKTGLNAENWKVFTTGIILMALAPLLLVILVYHYAMTPVFDSFKRMLRRYSDWRRDKENERRKDLRDQFLQANPGELYYNTMNGITAVMTPRTYELARKKTARLIQDERWNSSNCMAPVMVWLFFQQSGVDLLSNYGVDAYRYMSGWYSELMGLEEQYPVLLQRRSDIFVPLASEGLMPLDEQTRWVRQIGSGQWYDAFVMSQVPEDLHPLWL